MIPADPSGLLTTAEAARAAGVRPVTIRQWRHNGWLAPQGLNERGYPMHAIEAVRAAERIARGNALAAGHADPRRTRKPVPAL